MKATVDGRLSSQTGLVIKGKGRKHLLDFARRLPSSQEQAATNIRRSTIAQSISFPSAHLLESYQWKIKAFGRQKTSDNNDIGLFHSRTSQALTMARLLGTLDTAKSCLLHFSALSSSSGVSLSLGWYLLYSFLPARSYFVHVVYGKSDP